MIYHKSTITKSIIFHSNVVVFDAQVQQFHWTKVQQENTGFLLKIYRAFATC